MITGNSHCPVILEESMNEAKQAVARTIPMKTQKSKKQRKIAPKNVNTPREGHTPGQGVSELKSPHTPKRQESEAAMKIVRQAGRARREYERQIPVFKGITQTIVPRTAIWSGLKARANVRWNAS